MEGVTTGDPYSTTTTTVTATSPTRTSPRNAPMIAPPRTISPLRQSTETARIMDSLRELPNAGDILRLCDHAQLSVKGTLEKLRDRYCRYELRHRFPEFVVNWDPVEDERGMNLPFTYAAALSEPSFDETRENPNHTPSPATRNPPPLPSGQSVGPYRDPISFSDTPLTIYPSDTLTRPIPPPYPVVTFAPQPHQPIQPHPVAVSRTLGADRSYHPRADTPEPENPPLLETYELPRPQLPRHASTQLHRPTPSHPIPTRAPQDSRDPHSTSQSFGGWTMDSRAVQHFRRDGPKFAGRQGEDGEEFLLRLYEHGTSRGFVEADVLRVLPEAFTHEALYWYRVEHEHWSNYAEFLVRFRARFGCSDIQARLRREVEARTQGPDEPSGEYLTKMRTYFSHLQPSLSLAAQLSMCFNNLHPDLSLHLRREEIHDFLDFQLQCRKVEEQRERAKAYRPPPLPSQSVLPSAAYHPRTKGPKDRVAALQPPAPAPVPPPAPQPLPEFSLPSPKPEESLQLPRRTRPAPQPREEPVQALRAEPHESFARGATPAPPRRSPIPSLMDCPATPPRVSAVVRCYNCRQQGHVYRECTQRLGMFCRICGLPGTDVNSCSRCRRARSGNDSRGEI